MRDLDLRFGLLVAVNLVNSTVCLNCADAENPGNCDTVDVCNYDEVRERARSRPTVSDHLIIFEE